jgi:ParB-like nuclease domain
MDTLPSSPITPTTDKVVIAQLCRSRDYQVRHKLCDNTIKRYISSMKAGQVFPPLRVALVDNVPCLVDGFHRAAALQFLGHVMAEAVVVEATRDEALWMAAQANMTHGLPLKNTELRKVFKVYLQTGQYKKGSGKRKSFREMAEEIGKGHTTLWNWMKADCPKILRLYAKDEPNGKGYDDPIRHPPYDARPALKHLENARQAFQEATCPEAREVIRDRIRALAEDTLGTNWRAETDY